jgi:hypothetical protein
MGFGAKSPSYVPPPAAPPAAQPATLATSSVASKAANQQAEEGAALADFGASGTQGVNPGSVNTAKNSLGGAATLGG